MADALATLASLWEGPKQSEIRPLIVTTSKVPCHSHPAVLIAETDWNEWYVDILRFLKDGSYPEEASKTDRKTLRRLASQYLLFGNDLYRRTTDGQHLHCTTRSESQQLMEDIHAGLCGAHMNGYILSKKILRQGFYWTTMESDCIWFVRCCKECQVYGDLKHLPPMELQNLASPWPFSA